MLTVLAGIAAFERDLILQRTKEGRAKAEGKVFGCSPKRTTYQRREALKRLDAARRPARSR